MLRILLDQNVPRALGLCLIGQNVSTAAAQGWERLSNGALLKAAEAAGFSIFVTANQNIVYQQNQKARRIGLIVLSTNHWPTLRGNVERIASAIEGLDKGGFYFLRLVNPTPGT